MLHIAERYALFQEIRKSRNTKRMRGQSSGQPSIVHPALYHTAHIASRHRILRQPLSASNGCAKEWHSRIGFPYTTCEQVFTEKSAQVMPRRDFP
jgi:hypothetical protein